ncbi:hypothetical protein FA95DRAFT_944727 [Auriscalpium vulgare]|uniref:Uncharacterized protein n=1 Tax=Auriscalpium vulgare TaxID=40419 RepID=A0ACB8SBG7_9AGAM|nr:hypothetical protein FA95DRAFT_944727 [Auriscalpium vulgare]
MILHSHSSSRPLLLFLFLFLVGCVKVAGIIWVYQAVRLRPASAGRSYVGDDFPQWWDIGKPDPVRVVVDDTRHYLLDGAAADNEWAALAPGDGIIHLGEQRQPFSIAMFHQLRCLNILRQDLALSYETGEKAPESDLSRHCLNYLRQTVLCAGDVHVDPLLWDTVLGPKTDVYACRNFGAIYDAVEENQLPPRKT